MSAAEQQLLRELNETFEGFKVNLGNLRDPTEDFVVDFLAFFLSEFEVDPNSFMQLHFTQTVGISSYQDAFSGILPKANLMKVIKELNVIPDFGLRDIISPTPRRTQQVLRALMNYYEWADKTVGGIISKKEEMKFLERKKAIQDLLTKQEQLKQTKNNILKEIGQLQMEEAKQKEEYGKTKEKYDQLRLAKEVAKKESEEPASVYQEKENTLHKLEKEIVQVKHKIKECSNLIIDSPTVMLGDLQTLRAKQKELERYRDEKRDTVEAKMKTLQIVKQGLEDQLQRAEELSELFNLIEQAKVVGKDLASKEKKAAVRREKLKELGNVLFDWERKRKARSCFSEELGLKEEKIIPELKRCLEEVKSELELKQDKKKSLRKRLKDAAVIQDKIDKALNEAKNIVRDYAVAINRCTVMVRESAEQTMAAYRAQSEKINYMHKL